MELNNFQEVVGFALEKEKEAVVFYKECSKRTDPQRKEMKKAFLDMAGEEENHVRMLENFKPEHIDKIQLKSMPDLKISDYLVDMEFSSDMSYQDLLILSMKREESANHLYSDLGSRSKDPHVKKLFDILAQEELKHKNRLQKEYDDHVNRWN